MKFYIVLAIVSVTTAIDNYGSGSSGLGPSIGYGSGLGIRALGINRYNIGTGVGMNGLGIGGGRFTKQLYSSNHNHLGVPGIKRIGTISNNQIHSSHVGGGLGLGIGGVGSHGIHSSVGASHVGGLGLGIGGVSKQMHSSVGTSHVGGLGWGSGIGSMSKHQVHSSIDTAHLGPIGLGGIGSISKQIHSSSIGATQHHVASPVGIGMSKHITHSSHSSHSHHSHGISMAGLGALGHLNSYAALSAAKHLGVSSVATIPGGYFGGFLGAYPQAIPSTVSTSSLHIPGAAMDAYKGYFAGYYPGSIGYGHSYRFFH